MRFQATHKLVSYVLVAVAMASLAVAGLVSPIAAALSFAGFLISWFADPSTSLGQFVVGRGAMPARLGAVTFLGLTVWEIAAHLHEPDLSPVISLVLFLVVFKLFHRRSNRDYLHVYILSFLLMLAAAAFAQSAVFLVGFWLYVLLTTWTLMLFHLRREMEENYLVKHSTQAPSQKVGVHRILNSRRVVGRWFFLLTALVALVIFAGALVTFMLVPRVGAGFVLGGPKPRRFLVGFSDEVALGQSGFLSTDNREVALRATLPALTSMKEAERGHALDQLYWRGTVYDTYEHGRWGRSRMPALSTELAPAGEQWLVKEPGFRPSASGAPPLANTVRQEIEIVGLQVPVAFGLDRPVAFELGDTQPGLGAATELRLVPRWSSEVALRVFMRAAGAGFDAEDGKTAGGAHYVVYSRDSLAQVSASAGVPLDEIDPDVVRPYLALPAELSPRVRQLAFDITAGKTSAAAKVQAVTEWLTKTHGYSTQLKRHPSTEDPLEDFLFDQKAGHCEYFASASAILLRAAGVPTRYVNGFLGGEWNAFGKHVTVRQNRAHSWAEAYVGRFGWVRVDATPPIAASRGMSRLAELIDSLELWWSRWVVSYDFARQVDLVRSLGKQLGFFKSGKSLREAGGSWRDHKPAVGISLGLAALALVAWRWRRRHPRTREERPRWGPSGSPVGQLYARTLRRLASRGLARRPSETPREYLERMRGQGLAGWDVLQQITSLYEQAQFGGLAVDELAVKALARRLSEMAPASPGGTSLTKTTAAESSAGGEVPPASAGAA